MESKIVKIIDEHGIDRDANIICGFKLDENDYVLYWIERDNENDNLFVSKLLSNNDGTSNMLNIEDMMEKSRVTDITKQLITHAINSDNDKTENKLVLGNAEVQILTVKFNKEQNINVTKTYITTIKKAVTKVGEKFYHIESTNDIEPLFNDVSDPLKNDVPVSVGPEVENSNNEAEEFMNNVISEPISVEPINEVAVEDLAAEVVAPKVQDVSEVNVSNSTDNLGNLNVISEPVTSVVEPVDSSIVAPVIPVATDNVLSEDKKDEIKVDTVIPVTPVSPEVLPVDSVDDGKKVEPVSSPLIFDGAKETNLNIALGDTTNTNENVAVVNDVDALRQFGQHDNEVNDVNQPVEVNEVKNGGFANKKFFVVVAILLFVAACCFLGYEVYRYFQLTA